MKINTSHQHQPRKIIYTILGVVFLLLVAYGITTYLTPLWPFNKTQPLQDGGDSSQITNMVNYNPPNNGEINHSQDGKRNITGNNETDEDKSVTSGKNISVGVSFADITDNRLEIRAFTPSVVEGDGTCTATVTQGTSVISKTSKAFIDSTTSQCQPIYIPVSEFPSKGVWSLVVSYKSASSIGASEAIEVNI